MTTPTTPSSTPREYLHACLQTSVENITGGLFIPKVTEAMADAMVVVVQRFLQDYLNENNVDPVHDTWDGLKVLIAELEG